MSNKRTNVTTLQSANHEKIPRMSVHDGAVENTERRQELYPIERTPPYPIFGWDPVKRFFVPPELPWMARKCKEHKIFPNTGRTSFVAGFPDMERPSYGPPKEFDGLSSRPLKWINTIGDGHCGFRAISVMLTGSQKHFSIIRKRIAEFVVSKAPESWLRPHLPFPFHAESYVDRMSCASGLVGRRNCCTDVEIMAAAVLFDMNILCYKADRGKWQLYAHDAAFDQKDDVPTLLVELHHEHFTVVTDVESLQPKPMQRRGERNALEEIADRNVLKSYASMPSKERAESHGAYSETAKHLVEDLQLSHEMVEPQRQRSPIMESSNPMQRKNKANAPEHVAGIKLSDAGAAALPKETVGGHGAYSERAEQRLEDFGPLPVMVKPHRPGSQIEESSNTVQRNNEKNALGSVAGRQLSNSYVIPRSKEAARSHGAYSKRAEQRSENSRQLPVTVELQKPGSPAKKSRKTLVDHSVGASPSNEHNEDEVGCSAVVPGKDEHSSAVSEPSNPTASRSLSHETSRETKTQSAALKVSSKHVNFGPKKDSQWEPKSREPILPDVSNQRNPVKRLLFRPPTLPWMAQKCIQLNILKENANLEQNRPRYGPPKEFDGLSSQPLTELQIKDDEHRGFRAISKMITGSQEYFQVIRKRIAEFVARQASEAWLEPHLPSSFDPAAYVARMSGATESSGIKNYCTDVELRAAAVLFEMDILCYNPCIRTWQLYAHDKRFDQTADVPTLLVQLKYAPFALITDVEPLKQRWPHTLNH